MYMVFKTFKHRYLALNLKIIRKTYKVYKELNWQEHTKQADWIELTVLIQESFVAFLAIRFTWIGLQLYPINIFVWLHIQVRNIARLWYCK